MSVVGYWKDSFTWCRKRSWQRGGADRTKKSLWYFVRRHVRLQLPSNPRILVMVQIDAESGHHTKSGLALLSKFQQGALWNASSGCSRRSWHWNARLSGETARCSTSSLSLGSGMANRRQHYVMDLLQALEELISILHFNKKQKELMNFKKKLDQEERDHMQLDDWVRERQYRMECY